MTSKGKAINERVGLLFFATLYTFFFVGALFGYGPMQRMLEQHGAFHNLCDAADDSTVAEDGVEVCSTQSTTIINVNFIAICTNTLTPLIGQAIDHYGAPMVAIWFMVPCALLGTGILAIAAYSNLDHLFYAAFCFLGLATFSGSLMSVQVGLYFSGTMQVRTIMFLNALFDAGSVTYLMLWGLEYFFGLSFAQVTLVYFLLAVFQYGGGAYFWYTATPEDEDTIASDDESEQLVTKQERLESVRESMRDFQAAHMDNAKEMKQLLESYRNSLSSPRQTTRHQLAPTKEGYGSVDQEAQEEPQLDMGFAVAKANSIQQYDNGNKADADTNDDDYVLVADRQPKDQIFSAPFLAMTFFFAINMVSTNWSLTTAADFLASLGDNGKYLSLFTLMQPASILALPFVDATVQKLGFGAAFQMVNLLTFTYICIKLFVDDLNIQIIHFVMVAVVRCFLFAVSFSFLPRLLGPEAVGKGTGLLYLVGGIFSFANIPLAHLTSDGNFVPTNLLYLCLTIPTCLMVCYLNQTIKKEEAIKKSRNQEGPSMAEVQVY